MRLAIARLEEWMRLYYHNVDHDIGSSGVRDLTVGELGTICGFDLSELNPMIFHDSESFGGGALRAALADRWTGGDADGVMVTHGSSEAIYIVMHTLLDPGDEVIVVDPAYQQLYDIAAGMGCRITPWPLRAQEGFAADLPLLRKLAANGPRMIVVNFPHNPTGVSITPAQQQELIDIAAGAGAWLVWDHAFGELTHTAAPLPLPFGRYDKCITFGTFSKSYGLAGLRVGWCLAPPDLLARMAVLRDYIALYVSPVLEFFAEKAVRNADRIVAMQREHAHGNLRLLMDWAEGLPDLVRVNPPDGGVTAFVEFPGHPDATALCRRLAERDRVLLVPGECFGDAFTGYARLGFGGTTAELAAGLSSVRRSLLGTAPIAGTR
ncbi:capreomycidine synthase [Planomonospora sp. ID82291]|uniref:capreomycidine synthase n=1 Tax=Planomonospora sp. ID82291 TaxID=2738136 RepID=UPI0018C42AD9|nr:capreomycidine synthase [Planomonospora sp. ID82291]MBG0816359.1 capreomycidine synthase [Planomonospora sp. ID82291]